MDFYMQAIYIPIWWNLSRIAYSMDSLNGFRMGFAPKRKSNDNNGGGIRGHDANSSVFQPAAGYWIIDVISVRCLMCARF